MASSSNSREQLETKIDRISNLPESILCNIISLLPTRDQISTSLLSKTWLSLWTSVSDLDFDFYNTNFNLDRFTEFVDTVLLRLRRRSIRKLRLNCDFNYLSSKIDPWINVALARNVQELELQLGTYPEQKKPDPRVDFNFRTNPGPYRPNPGPYRPNLVNCNSLLVLKLSGSIAIKFGEFDLQFPSLKTLHLNWDDSVPKLLSGCPALEELVLNNCHGDDDISICVPTLRSLSVFFQTSATCNLVLDALALEFFSFQRYCFGTSYDPVNQLAQLLQTLPSIKYLNVSSFTVQSLHTTFNGFPVLNNLVTLKIDVYQSYEWVRLLESCHNLENIFLHKRYYTDKTDALSWSRPCFVPKCLSSRLKTFHFERFIYAVDEMSFSIYVLENAMVLKNMVIKLCSDLTPEKRCSVASRLQTVEMGSKACQLIIK